MSTNIARSLGDYFSIVREIRKQWKTPENKELWFRAEDSKHLGTTSLQPGLYRPKDGSRPKPIKDLLMLENDLYEEFLRCSPQFSDSKASEDDWEWETYFLMQHHGVRTRLLDWSDGALIALHFAVREKAVPPKSGSIIYVLDPDWLAKLLRKHPERRALKSRWKKFARKDPYHYYEDEWERLYLPLDEDDADEPLLTTPKIPMLDDPRHITRRIAAQRSRFMIFGTDPSWLSKLATKRGSRITPITIPVGAITPIKFELREAGITESVIYPDLDGLGREFKQMWDLSGCHNA